jgi:hypothetical protein
MRKITISLMTVSLAILLFSCSLHARKRGTNYDEAKVPAYAAALPKGNYWLPASVVADEEKDYQLN